MNYFNACHSEGAAFATEESLSICSASLLRNLLVSSREASFATKRSPALRGDCHTPLRCVRNDNQ